MKWWEEDMRLEKPHVTFSFHPTKKKESTYIFLRTQWFHKLQYFMRLQYINKDIMRDLDVSPYRVSSGDVESQDCTVILLC